MTQPRPKSDARKQRLTELCVRKVKPGKTFLVWDSYQHGLALRVQPTGSRAWKCIYSRQGRPTLAAPGRCRRHRIERRPHAGCRGHARGRQGQGPGGRERAERGAGTFAELAERSTSMGYARKRNKSWRQADALVRRHACRAGASCRRPRSLGPM